MHVSPALFPAPSTVDMARHSAYVARIEASLARMSDMRVRYMERTGKPFPVATYIAESDAQRRMRLWKEARKVQTTDDAAALKMQLEYVREALEDAGEPEAAEDALSIFTRGVAE